MSASQERTATPRVSVVMLAYNFEDTIDTAIAGVMGQHAPFDIELIVADDASTDKTLSRAAAWQTLYPDRIRVLETAENMGLARNYLRAFKACRGEYIALCDGDDWWCDAHKVARQVAWLDAHPSSTVCFHRAVIWHEDTGELALSNGSTRGLLTASHLAASNFIVNATVMYRRNAVEHYPDWLTATVPDYGYHMLHAAAAPAGAPIGYLPQAMTVYRQRRGAQWSAEAPSRRLAISLLIRELLIDALRTRPDLQAPLRRAAVSVGINLAAALLREGERRRADEIFDRLRVVDSELSREDFDRLLRGRLTHAGVPPLKRVTSAVRRLASLVLRPPRPPRCRRPS